MSLLSELIEGRIKAAEMIVSLAREQASPTQAHILSLVPHYTLHGQTSVKALMEHQASLLEDINEQLRTTQRDFLAVVQDPAKHWETRLFVAADLERVIWHAQGRIAEPFGPDMLRLYGLEEHPPAGFRALATYAHNAITLLRAHPQTLEGQFNDLLETELIAQSIEEPLLALNDFLVSFDDAPDELKEALHKRDHISDQWMRIWRSTSTVLEGIFLLADRPDLASRVRPFLPDHIFHEDEFARSKEALELADEDALF